MRRVLSVLFTAVTAVLLSTPHPSAQQVNLLGSTGGQVLIQATNIVDLRIWDAFVIDAERSGTLRLRSSERDLALPSRTIERFEQFYGGLRIWGADVIRDSELGVPVSIFGSLSPELTLSTDPSLSSSAALDALRQTGGSESMLFTTPELVIVRLDTGTYRLIRCCLQ